jgi:solute carrier family 25 carnitine/acylcarnitine transporter 20/29
VLVGHPFDTTKTRLQVAPTGHYTGTLDCVQKTFQKQGIRGFYSGIGSPLIGQMIFRATSFGTFYYSVKILNKNDDYSIPTARNLMIAGAITGFAISFVETPIDLIKTKLQIQVFENSRTSTVTSSSSRRLHATTSVLNCTLNIINKYGARGLWQGWSATAIRNIPVIYYLIKLYFNPHLCSYNLYLY